MFRIPLLLFVALMVAGCARPEERVIIVKQNQFFQCESDQLIRKIDKKLGLPYTA